MRRFCCFDHGQHKILEGFTLHRCGRVQLCTIRDDPCQWSWGLAERGTVRAIQLLLHLSYPPIGIPTWTWFLPMPSSYFLIYSFSLSATILPASGMLSCTNAWSTGLVDSAFLTQSKLGQLFLSCTFARTKIRTMHNTAFIGCLVLGSVIVNVLSGYGLLTTVSGTQQSLKVLAHAMTISTSISPSGIGRSIRPWVSKLQAVGIYY